MKRTLFSAIALIWVAGALAQTSTTAPATTSGVSNVSLRSTIANGGSSIVGFVINGTANRTVLIRAVGPTLGMLGVINALDRPVLSLYSGRQLLAVNSGWGTGATAAGMEAAGPAASVPVTGSGSATLPSSGSLRGGKSFSVRLATAADFGQAGAFGLPAGSSDAAFVANLPAGAYTVVVSGGTAAVGGTPAASLDSAAAAATGPASGLVPDSTAATSSVATTGSTTDGIPTTGLPATPIGGDAIGSTAATPIPATGSAPVSAAGNSTITVTPPPFTATTGAPSGGDVLVEVYFLD